MSQADAIEATLPDASQPSSVTGHVLVDVPAGPSLFRVTGLMFAMSTVGNIGNYLFQFYAGRTLTAPAYGELNSLLAVFLIASVGAGSLQQMSARYTSRFGATGELGLVPSMIARVAAKITVIVVIGLAVFVPLSPLVQRFLHLASAAPLVVTVIAVVLGFYVNLLMGVLQGLHRFTAFGMCNGQGAFRLVLGVIFIGAGLGVVGGLLATAGAIAIALIISIVALRRLLRDVPQAKWHASPSTIAYGAHVLIATSCFNALGAIDLIAAKHYFPSDVSGHYAAAAVLGRVVLYAPAAVVVALFPMVSSAATTGRTTSHLLRNAMLLTGMAAGAIAIGYLVVPGVAISALLGQRYLPAAPLLALYGLAVLPQAFLNVLMNFNLARHATRFVFGLVPVCVLQIAALASFHHSPYQLIFITGIAGCAALLVAITAQ